MKTGSRTRKTTVRAGTKLPATARKAVAGKRVAKKPAAVVRAASPRTRAERSARAELGLILDQIHRTLDETEALLAG